MNEFPFTGTTQRQRMPHAEIPGCALVQDLIPLYLDGEVTPESHVLIADHLQRCERCSGYLAGARTVRPQILSEQQAMRAAGPQPTVTQLREPVANSFGMALWQSLMVLIYANGLVLGLISSVALGESFGPIAPIVLVIGGLAGLLVVGSARTRIWLMPMLATGVGGVLLILVALLSGGSASTSMVMYGLVVAALGAWGVWLHRTQRPAPTTRSTQRLQGPHQAIFTALLSVVGTITCSVLALASLLNIVYAAERGWFGHMLASGLVLSLSVCAILLIIRQRGWSGSMIRQ
jgi:predicted anti-sigma-YlaC factor YlaD